MIRHGTAMVLLQAGMAIAVMALYQRHDSVGTTHIYREADILPRIATIESDEGNS
jgi:site-specific recombinase XerD